MAFTIYIYIQRFFYYYYCCCYYKTCLQAGEWKVHCAWKIPNIAWRKKRLNDTDPAKRYHIAERRFYTMVLQFYYAEDTFQLSCTSKNNRNWPTPMIRFLCETLTVMQFVTNYPAFYVTDNFITIFTRLRFHILLRISLTL